MKATVSFDSENNRYIAVARWDGTAYSAPGDTVAEAVADIAEQIGFDAEEFEVVIQSQSRSDAYRDLSARLDESRRLLNSVRDENEFAAGWHEIERQRFAVEYQGDAAWMSERRMEAGMLGEWDFENGHPL